MKNISSMAAFIRCPLFSGYLPEEIVSLFPHLGHIQRVYEKGDFLLFAGHPVRHFGIVLEGNLHIITEDFWGRRSLLGTAGPGELFGEAFVCAGIGELPVSVMAESRSAVSWMDMENLEALPPPDHRRIMDNLLRILAHKNLLLTQKIGHMSKNSTREKLLSYLSAEARKSGKNTFSIPLDRQHLADYLGVDRSAMSAVLSQMQKEGLLEYRKNQFTLKK